MKTDDPFEIKNYRLIKQKNEQQSNIKFIQNPLDVGQSQLYNFKNENYAMSEQFGNVYTGDLLSSLAVIKYKGKDKLDQLQINLNIELENKKQEVSKENFKIEDINSEIKLPPIQLRIEALDNYVFIYTFVYKVKSALQQTQTLGEIKPFIKKYRIMPKLPFKQECRINAFLAPIYMLEYTFTNTSDNTLSFKKIDFKTDSPFESTLIENDNQDYSLLPDERYKIMFKLTIKANEQKIYNDLLSKMQGEIQINIGNLILEWGICGVFVGTSVPLNLTTNDISVEILNTQKQIFEIEQISEIIIQITNLTGNQQQLKVILKEIDMEGLKILSVDKQIIKIQQQNQKTQLKILVLPIYPGIQLLKGLIFMSEINNSLINYKNNLQLLVQNKKIQLENQQLFEISTVKIDPSLELVNIEMI